MQTRQIRLSQPINVLYPALEEKSILRDILRGMNPDTKGYIAAGSQLLHPVICRYSKSRPTQVRYEVVSSLNIGSGCSAMVQPVLVTIEIDDNNEFIYKNKVRVAKLQELDTHRSSSVRVAIQNESQISQRIEHLHSKKVAIDEVTGMTAIVMRRMPGVTMDFRFSIKPIVTINQRLNLTYALLIAYRDQVASANVIHRDNKIENVMVEEKNGVESLRFIDFGLSKFANEDEEFEGDVGNFLCKAPEVCVGTPANITSEIYSLGMMIAETWSLARYCGFASITDARTFMKTRYFVLTKHNLFQGLSVSEELRNALLHVVNSMIAYDPDNRPTLRTAIERVDSLRTSYIKSTYKNVIQKANYDKAHRLGSGLYNEFFNLFGITEENVLYFMKKFNQYTLQVPDEPVYVSEYLLMSGLDFPSGIQLSVSALLNYTNQHVSALIQHLSHQSINQLTEKLDRPVTLANIVKLNTSLPATFARFFKHHPTVPLVVAPKPDIMKPSN